jgi:arylsulfatase
MGPFDAWPTGGGGFEYFYGFLGGETNQWYPALYEGTTPIEPEKTPKEGYHFTDDMTTKAIRWVQQQKALMADKPFFMYFAPGATHAPHHVPREWADKYKGKFDKGWDLLRDEIFARQKELGVIPQDCRLTERHSEVPAWETIATDLRPVFARQMELYAGFMEHTDHHIGRLIDTLQDLGVLDDTLIYLIVGDNGASAEGTLQGAYNELAPLTGFPDLESPEFMKAHIDKLGGVEAYNHYAVGWAHAMDTPYQWTKQVASHWGGTRNGLVVHWPKGITEKGGIRTQFHHVIDVAPSLLEAAKLPEPLFVNGVAQKPIEGVSMVYSFNDATGAERRETQYFEIAGNRGIYHKGWTAVTRHRTPWLTGAVKLLAFDDDVWELYDTNTDWSQSRDLSKELPDKLHDLQRLWMIEAVKYNVLPLDDRFAERANPELAGRPQLITGSRQLLFGGMGRLTENSVINFKNKSHSVTAEIVVPHAGAEGVIIAQGGLIGGWSLYAKSGKPKYCYNFYGVERYYIEGSSPLPAGKHQVRMEFAYDGGGLAKGGTVSLYIDGAKCGEGRVERTEPLVFSADETCDVGFQAGSPTTDDYGERGTKFTGDVNWVEIDVGKDAINLDHLITPEDRLHLAMARQ